MMAVVSIIQNDSIRTSVEESIRLLGGIESFVKPQDKVVIKPNLVFGLPPFTGFTTDPPIVQAILELCQNVSPLELAVPGGLSVQELQVPRVILDCDVLINVPKLKLYRQVPGHGEWASLAVKNLMGALPGKGVYSHNRPPGFSVQLSREFLTAEGKYFHSDYRQWWSPSGQKKRIHGNLVQGLSDINMVIKPTLNVIDAIIVSNDVNMTDTTGMKTLELNTILASRDALALDCIAVRIAGLNPFNISYLKHAIDRGLGESDYNRIQLHGTPLEQLIKAWNTELAACHDQK